MSCPHDPRLTTGPIGMYHCPECGEMVVALMPHPDYDTPLTEEDYAIIAGRACSMANHSAACYAQRYPHLSGLILDDDIPF